MGGGHQGPLPIHLLQPSQQETIQPPGPFGLTEYWLDDGFAQGVDRLTATRPVLASILSINRCAEDFVYIRGS